MMKRFPISTSWKHLSRGCRLAALMLAALMCCCVSSAADDPPAVESGLIEEGDQNVEPPGLIEFAEWAWDAVDVGFDAVDLVDVDLDAGAVDLVDIGEVALLEADVDIVIGGNVVADGAADKQKAADDDWDDELEPEPGVVAQQRFVVNDATFDQWMFNQLGNAQKATEKFHTSLNVQIDSIAAACELAPEQKQKLLLAGRGDIHRFFDQVEVCRKKFDKVKTDQNRINEIWQDIQPLQMVATAGLFDEKSLFQKVVKRTLNEEQSAKVNQIETERRKYQFKAKVELIVAAIDDTLAMRADQRKELVALLLETPPPKRYSQYDSYLLLYKISKLPEEKLKKLLDPPQWRALDRQLEQARNLEQFLRQQGILSDEELKR